MMCENPTTVQGLYMNFSFTFEVPHAEFERISRLQKWSTLSMSSWDIMALAWPPSTPSRDKKTIVQLI